MEPGNPCLGDCCSRHSALGSPASPRCRNSASFSSFSLPLCSKGLSVSAQMGILLPPSQFTFPALFFPNTVLPKIESWFFESVQEFSGRMEGVLVTPCNYHPKFMLLLALRWESAQKSSPGTALDFLPQDSWGWPITHHEAGISADTVQWHRGQQPSPALHSLSPSPVLCSLRSLSDEIVPSCLPVLYWVPERIGAPAPLGLAELCPPFKV